MEDLRRCFVRSRRASAAYKMSQMCSTCARRRKTARQQMSRRALGFAARRTGDQVRSALDRGFLGGEGSPRCGC